MQTNTINVMTLAALCVVIASCTKATNASDACGDGEAVQANGSNFCVYEEAIVIVGGFDCPASMPFRMDFESATVCGNHGFDNIDVPNDICARVFVPCTPIEDSDAGVVPLMCGGRVCDLPYATGVCIRTECVIDTCDVGFSDCDGQSANGCETSLNTINSCGACGLRCATLFCQAGQCVNDPVMDGGPVDVSGYCASDIIHGPEVCGDQWDNDCDALVDESSCVSPEDRAVCDVGYSDCNLIQADGCETSITTAANCGACDRQCPSAHVTATCLDGACVLNACDAGFGDCDGAPENGCETLLNTLTSCGACGVTCSLANGAAICVDGVCAVGACDVGFGDCDGDPANGCETSLNTLTDCGGCNVACVGVSMTCSTGTCRVVASL